MSWISYLYLAYVSVALQVGAARAMEWHGGSPDFVLIAAVFIALNASRDAALLGCFILGAMHDLAGQGPPGLYAFSYGLVGLMIMPLQRALRGDHSITHFAATLLAASVTAAIILLHQLVRPERADSASGEPAVMVHQAISPILYSALYTAVLAPLVLWLLNRWRGVFHFQGARRRIMATRRV
jgi:rod shape-determining protein MreD